MKKLVIVGMVMTLMVGCTGDMRITVQSVNEYRHACDKNGGIVEYSLYRMTGTNNHKVGGVTCADGAKLSRSVAASIHDSIINAKVISNDQ